MGKKKRCRHDASSQSTLKIMSVRAVDSWRKMRFSCTCEACGRMTDWYYTRYEAQVEAWYECWMKEY